MHTNSIIQKLMAVQFLFFYKLLFYQLGSIKLIKIWQSEHFRILQYIFISNKYCSFELSIHQNPGKNESWFLKD